MKNLSKFQIRKIKKEIQKEGYSIIKQLLSKREVEKYLSLISANYENLKKKKYQGLPSRDKNDKVVYNLQNKNFNFIKLITNKNIVNICKIFLNDEHYRQLPKKFPNYILSFYNARSSGEKLNLHIDSHTPHTGKYINMMQFSFVLNNQNKRNGCTTAVPRSHKSGQYSNRKTKKIKFLESDPGDLVIWDSRLWHGAGKNLDKKERWSIIATFSRWWIKQSMNIPKSLPTKFKNKLTNAQKIILGFGSVPPENEFSRINTKLNLNEIQKSS